MSHPDKTTTYDHSRIVQLHKSGVPSSHIARRLGCERKTVSRAIREWMSGKPAEESKRREIGNEHLWLARN